MTAGTVSPSATSSGTLTTALSEAVGPTATIRYFIDAQGTSSDTDLTLTVALGTAKVQGTYTAAPAGP